MSRRPFRLKTASVRLVTGLLYFIVLISVSGDLRFSDPAGALLFVLFVAASTWKSFPTASIGVVNLNFAPILGALFVYSPLEAAWIAGVGTALGLVFARRRSVGRVVRSIGAFGIQAALAGTVYELLGGAVPFVLGDAYGLVALVPAVVTYFAANQILVGLPEGLGAKLTFRRYLSSVAVDDVRTYLITVPAGILMASLYLGWGAFAALLLALTLFLFGASLEDLARLSHRLATRTEYLSVLNRIGRKGVGKGVDREFLSFVSRECEKAVKSDATVAIGILDGKEMNRSGEPITLGTGLSAINLGICEFFARRSLAKRRPIVRRSIQREELEMARGPAPRGSKEFAWYGRFVQRYLVHSILVVPIRAGKKNMGALVVQRREESTFGRMTVQFVATVAHQVATAIENDRLYREQVEKRRLEGELRTARQVQQRLLPERIPQLALFDLAAVSVPSQQVGGDYYDFVILDPDHLAIVIADVTGKGIPAAILMSNLQAAVRTLALGDHSVIYAVSSLNDTLCGSTEPHQFATLFYAVLEVETGGLEYSNAGHNPPIVLRADGSVEFLETGGALLGVLPGVDYALGRSSLASGDTLVLYTDGVVEAENSAGEEYGENRLVKLLAENRDLTASELRALIVDDVRRFQTSPTPSDDIALVIVKAN